MRLALISDAWFPQVNGVVTTLHQTAQLLAARGHEVTIVSPGMGRSVPCPTYPAIRLALFPWRVVDQVLGAMRPEAIHIATEGPLGLAARHWCVARQQPFTTSFHTSFPEYVQLRTGLPPGWLYRSLRWFHGAARRTMVATPSLRQHLLGQGFSADKLVYWSRGVDLTRFRPGAQAKIAGPRPYWVYAGRVAVEKNLDAFLALDLPGTKIVVGDGPDRARLQARYPHALFAGMQHGNALVEHLAAADVFVFPSRTDTFGIVLIEAMACGVPIAAYPVTGPRDVVQQGVTGCLDEDLGAAARGALALGDRHCRAAALAYTWERATTMFCHNLWPIHPPLLSRTGRNKTRAPAPLPVA